MYITKEQRVLKRARAFEIWSKEYKEEGCIDLTELPHSVLQTRLGVSDSIVNGWFKQWKKDNIADKADVKRSISYIDYASKKRKREKNINAQSKV